ncbi:BatA and WFA domain-containing protein [Mucilaginibacter sp. SD-g]|uniref:BatA and WFA domain-containing protein n=1 Tax=Mucilaginibacter segetis TaxID=2793071 RepID=A0A934PT58_9SPHI|nr:BatA and WFA domain-containing protein [Mucilaginibacter segetis]
MFALLTLAIPVLVHLFNFKRYKKVYFSNVQFLKEVQEQQASRRNIKERLILAARMLALAFLVFAFARPFIPGKEAANAGKQQVVSIFVDNSYSMQNLSPEGSLLDVAKQKAKQIAAAYSMNDRFQLLTQDFEGKHQRLLNREEFNDAVDAVKISPQSRTLDQIIARQRSLMDMQPNAVKSSYVISDFQKNIKPPTVISDSAAVKLVQLKANVLPNVAVDTAWMLNAIHRPDETEKMVVRLRNYADKSAERIPLKLTINGVQKAIGSFTVDARSSQTDTLTFSGLKAGWQRAQIQLQDNPVIFDNDFYMAFKVNDVLPVLLINDGTANKYLKAVFGSDDFFLSTNVNSGNVDYSSLNNYPLIVLSDIKNISTGLAQQLNAYTRRGGTLMIFPSADADLISYQALLQPMGAAYPVKLITEDVRASTINLRSAVFKDMFESIPRNPDLPKVKKYYDLNTAGKGGEELMRLATGQPLWEYCNYLKGKVYLCAVPLDERFSNLPVHGLFVPVIFRIALLSGHDQPLFYSIDDKVIETPPLQSTEKQLVKLIKGEKEIIPDIKQQEGATIMYLPDELAEPGIYDLKKQDSTAGVIAFNNNRSESDMSYLNTEQMSELFLKKAKIYPGNRLNATNINATENSGLQLWKLCIILALIFLAAETLLIRFYKTSTGFVSQPG